MRTLVILSLVFSTSLAVSACGRVHISSSYGQSNRSIFRAQAEKRPRNGREVALFTSKDAERAVNRNETQGTSILGGARAPGGLGAADFLGQRSFRDGDDGGAEGADLD